MGFGTVPVKIELSVHLAYDEEAKVWYVAHSEIPGLSLEAESPAVLMERVECAAMELVELNLPKIIADHEAKARRAMKPQRQRPSVSFRPVFDSPYELNLACA